MWFPKIPPRLNIGPAMGIDDLKARLERLLGEHTRPTTAREQMQAMHAVLVDLKTGLRDLRDALQATERELAAEQEQLVTAERRGRLASNIDDGETARLAGVYAARHRERIDLLARKLEVQREELALVEREYAELAEKYRSARQGLPPEGSAPVRPALDEDELLRMQTDRQATEAAVNAQLEALKRKLGKQS